MNPMCVALALLLTTLTCFAQGQVNFANRVGAGGSILNAPVTIMGTMDGPGPDWSAQLLLVGANGSLTPLTPVSTFNKAGTGAAAISSQFWAPQTVTINGHFAGESVTFLVRAWLTSLGTFDNASRASIVGQSDPFDAVLGGASSDASVPPTTPANLLALKSFTIGFFNEPEPSTITIGLLGAAVLVLFGRRR